MLITVSALRPGDIIVSTTDAGVSAVIRAGIGSSVSHSMIYVGGSAVIEAIEEGVRRRPLAAALANAVLAIALRRRNLTEKQRADVVKYATRFMWRPYDHVGAAGSGTSLARGGLLAALGCGISLGFCALGTAGVANNAKLENADRAFLLLGASRQMFRAGGCAGLGGLSFLHDAAADSRREHPPVRRQARGHAAGCGYAAGIPADRPRRPG